MRRNREAGVERVIETARLLGELAEEVVFLGGAVAGLLVTDPAAPSMRPTLDIDVIVEAMTRGEYYAFQDRLRARGFREAMDETVICRFRNGPIVLDVMPTEPTVLGFSNRWYADAARNAEVVVADSVKIRCVSPVYFLATKLEAYHGRGGGDFMLSHDMEDIVSVVDGRAEIVDEIGNAEPEVRRYLGSQFAGLLKQVDFLDALPGYLPGDAGSQRRLPLLVRRLERLAEFSPF